MWFKLSSTKSQIPKKTFQRFACNAKCQKYQYKRKCFIFQRNISFRADVSFYCHQKSFAIYNVFCQAVKSDLMCKKWILCSLENVFQKHKNTGHLGSLNSLTICELDLHIWKHIDYA